MMYNVHVKIKETAKNIALLFCTVFLVFIGIEVFFRIKAYHDDKDILDDRIMRKSNIPVGESVHLGHMIQYSREDDIVYELKSNLNVNYVGAEVKTNSSGFKDKKYSLSKKPGTIRIIGIGDSVMFGQGAPMDMDYLSVLEDLLNNLNSGDRWEVINMAVPGYNTTMEVAALASKGLAYRPDIVILGFLGNDLSLPNFIRQKENCFSLDKLFLRDFIIRVRYAYPFYNNLQYLKGLTPAPDKDGERFGISNFEDKPELVPKEYAYMVGWDGYVDSMKKLKRLGEANNFKVVLLFFRTHREQVVDEAMSLASGIGFQYIIDTLPIRETT